MSSHGAQAASVAPAATGSVFGGFTSQRLPSFFQLSKDGRTLKVGAITLNMSCASGSKYVTPDDFSSLRITAGGRFSGRWRVPPIKLHDGAIYAGYGSMTGHLDRRHQRVTGTWQEHDAFVFTSGQADACASGVVRFTALQ